jgi:hypothetical protein
MIKVLIFLFGYATAVSVLIWTACCIGTICKVQSQRILFCPHCILFGLFITPKWGRKGKNGALRFGCGVAWDK